MKMLARIGLMLLLCAPLLNAQELPWKLNFDKYANEATETVDVTLDKNMLNLAKNFLSDKDADQRQAKEIVSQLNGIYVRSYEFDKPGMYSDADIESFRAQLKAPEWNRIVGVRSKRGGENDFVYVRQVNGKMTGLAVIAAEAREFTLVYIDGPIDLAKISSLGGQFGVPRFYGSNLKIDVGKKGDKE
ncbi:hypothetical protein Acid345_4399 [Candidatus Koribacter versatilis Ellin345]|uniref:DUF4252 domain-containing protein n=1 Tax=Koribacter versatilis (strain Ellin345) TaxID=204669 RepID=Q1IIA1_KORVE|nr:DUF4252 domain-containing protein [Candidatus Koribacter versatilis]ABF43399.1 hypothetical protein Acid345_4399 [Candidatus Koribacter versatilis Ellin345]